MFHAACVFSRFIRLHGYVPQELMATLMGKDAWWAVPAAVGIGVPVHQHRRRHPGSCENQHLVINQ